MNNDLAQKLHATEGQSIVITSQNTVLHLPLHVDDSLAENMIGLPAGFPGISVALPAWAKLQLDNEAAGV